MLADSSRPALLAAVKPLKDDKVQIISVLLGSEADANEGNDLATSKNDVITVKDRDSPRRITNSLMNKAISGTIIVLIKLKTTKFCPTVVFHCSLMNSHVFFRNSHHT